MRSIKVIPAMLLLCLLALNFQAPSPAVATNGSIYRIDVTGQILGATVTRTVYNSGWTSYRTSYFDLGGGNGVTIRVYASGGTLPYYHDISNNQGWDDYATSYDPYEDFYPYPPIDGTYRAYVDGSTPGDFYIRGYYPDLLPSTPSPENGAVSPPFCTNQLVNWYVTVTNQGDGSASDTSLYYYLGSSSGDTSRQIGSDTVSDLDPLGDSGVESYGYTFTTSDLGTRYLNALADAEDDEDEEDEGNNDSSYGPFQVIGPPGAVSLSSPVNGTGTCNGAVSFAWSAYAGATSYEIQVDNNSDFSSPERTATLTSPTTSYVASPALTPNRWYWRVRARNACDFGTWSDPWYVDVLTTPGVPGLTSPLANASTCDTTPTFEWTAVSGATLYRIQLDDNTAFSSPSEATTAGLSYTPSAQPTGDLYWRVRAENACGAGSYSAYRKLTISGPPAVPAPLSPDNGSSACTLLPSFSWSSVADATSYSLQLDNNSDFTTPEATVASIPSPSYTFSSPLGAGLYYWRVVATGTCGSSAWSSPGWSHELVSLAPAPVLLNPADDDELCTLSPTFTWQSSFQADQYRFQLSTSPTFSPLSADETTTALLYNSSGLDPDAYYWRVRGENECGSGSWTSTRSLGLHNPVIQADFSASPLLGNLPLQVSFFDQSLGEISTWDWDFGDGGSSDQQNPLYTYDQSGSFDVSLSVGGFCGSDTTLLSDYIQVTDLPVSLRDLRESNVRDSSYTISWVTDVASTGYIEYGKDATLGAFAFDSRGTGHSGYTHFVPVLADPETTYYYDVINGSTRDDNGGLHYTVTTGPTLGSVPPSDVVYGQVFRLSDGLEAAGALVYITLRDDDGAGSPGQAALLSALVDSGGYWNANLGNARLADLSASFAYSLTSDELYLYAEGEPFGVDCQLVATSNDAPAADLNVGEGCTITPDQKVFIPLILQNLTN